MHRPMWRNQALTVYHGTLDEYVPSILRGIDLSKCHEIADFGRGFYTTTNMDQARTWAESLVKRVRRHARPGIVRFTIPRNDLASLDSLWFVRGSPDANDYWDLVRTCRELGTSNRSGSSFYDVVVGPVARMYQVRRAYPNYDQISFHTDRAVQILDNTRKGELH